jgi:hypothetical protein
MPQPSLSLLWSLLAYSRTGRGMKTKAQRLIGTRRRQGFFLLAALVLLAAIGALTWRASSHRTPPSDAETQLEEAITAFRLLKDNYVDPPDPATLLTAGWTGARDAVGRTVPGIRDEPPRYSADVHRDEASFPERPE